MTQNCLITGLKRPLQLWISHSSMKFRVKMQYKIAMLSYEVQLTGEWISAMLMHISSDSNAFIHKTLFHYPYILMFWEGIRRGWHLYPLQVRIK